jgi:ABC-type multidrug transport system fused ATPase/permease subunit
VQQVKSEMTVVAEESYQNIRTVKAFANEDEESRKFKKGNENLFNMNRKKDTYSFKAILIESLLKYPCEDNLCDWLGLAHSLPISEIVTFKFAILDCSEMEL